MNTRILTVDDDQRNVLRLDTLLADSADEIREVTDSQQLEQAFTELEQEIVLLDAQTPEANSLEILRRPHSARLSLRGVTCVPSESTCQRRTKA